MSTLAFFAVATTVLTWPLAFSPGAAISIRGDYFMNLWNIWWVGEALTDPNETIYWSDYLHYPVGVSLARHALTPANSISGAILSTVFDLHDVFKILLWIHFWLSAWTFYLFARVITASHGGAVLGGLFWSFSPFHFYYISQMNVTTMEFLPLLGFFLIRSYREGGRANAIGVAASVALLAASSSYYLVYGGLLGGFLLLGGRLWEPDVRWRAGVRRLLIAAGLAAVSVAAVSWRLLSAGSSAGQITRALEQSSIRANDLLGYTWVGGPEILLVSWPTLLGYSGVALAAIGVRIEGQRLFWLGLCFIFFVLGLGPELHIQGRPTGIPLPYSLFSELPVLWMLRKPDRIFVMVLLAAGVLAAFGWREIAARLKSPGLAKAAWIAVVVLLSVERAAIPLKTFNLTPSPYLEELATNSGVTALVDLPHMSGSPSDARSNYFQTIHGKKVPQGYVVNLALGSTQRAQAREWRHAYQRLSERDPEPLFELVTRDRIDAVVLRKTRPKRGRPRLLSDQFIGSPFLFVRHPLIEMRQRGPTMEAPVPESTLHTQREALTALLGPPAYEDELIIVFLASAM